MPAPQRDAVWTERLLGPIGGLALATAVLTMSFLVGRLDGWDYVKGLGAVGVAAAVAVITFGLLFENHAADVIQQGQTSGLEITTDKIDAAETTLRHALNRVEAALEKEVGRLAELLDIDDAELATIEASPNTRRVIICRREMGDEFERDDPASQRFEDAVKQNLERSVEYAWITEDNAISRHRERLVLERFASHASLISVRRIDPTIWQTLPFTFEAVFIVQVHPSVKWRMLGYAEVSFGMEDVRTWRKVGNRYCTEWYDQVKRLLDGDGS